MYEKSEQLTGNSISRLITTQRKQNAFQFQQLNGVKQAENRIFRYPYLMERSTEKIKDDRSDKGSEKPLPKIHHRRKIFQARSTMQSQMKQSTLSMDRNRTNSANNHDKNPVRQKIKNSCNKSYGRRVSQQGSFTQGTFFGNPVSVPVVFSYQSPTGPFFHPSINANQQHEFANRNKFFNTNYQQLPINRTQQRPTVTMHHTNFVDQRPNQMMANSNIYRIQQLKPKVTQSFLSNSSTIQPPLNPYPPGFPALHLPTSLKHSYNLQTPSLTTPNIPKNYSPRPSPPKQQSPVKIKNIKNIINSNPNLISNIQQIMPKPTTISPITTHHNPILTNSRPLNCNPTKNSDFHQIHNLHNLQKSILQSEEQNGKHAYLEVMQHRPVHKNMYESSKGGDKYRKNDHQHYLNVSPKKQISRKRVPSITQFGSTKNIRNSEQFDIDLHQPEDTQNMHHDQNRYQDRFFDIQDKHSIKHEEHHRTHKILPKVPETKKHFSQDFKSPQSSPEYGHKNEKVKSAQIERDTQQRIQVQKRSSKALQTAPQLHNKQKQNKAPKLINQGKLITFFLLLFGIVLVFCQIIK